MKYIKRIEYYERRETGKMIKSEITGESYPETVKIKCVKIIEAPSKIYKDGRWIKNYNFPHNHDLLIADGYQFYNGKCSLDQLEIDDDGNITEKPASQRLFSKLKIRRTCRVLGIESKLDSLLAANEMFQKDWTDALEIDLADESTKQALLLGSFSDYELENIQNIINASKNV